MNNRAIPNRFNCSMRRVENEELLDLGHGSFEDVVKNLAEMHWINLALGGTRALTDHLYPRLQRHQDPVTLLDVGTGGAGLPRAIAAWARKKKLPVQILAVDWSARNLAAARRMAGKMQDIHLVRANALHLPFQAGKPDYIISSLFLHHLRPEQVIAVLRQSFSLANRAVVMSDLVRGWLPFLAFKLVQPVFARNVLTRHDGELSIRRAYTPLELEQLVRQADLPGARIYEHWPWRMTLVVDK